MQRLFRFEGKRSEKLGNIINRAPLEKVKEIDKLTLFALKVAFRQGLEDDEESTPKLL
jgi:hypothetical protein